MTVVCILNAVLAFFTALALFDSIWEREFALVILGDAQHSFLETPDPTTKGQCLRSKSDVDRYLDRGKRWTSTYMGQVCGTQGKFRCNSLSSTEWILTLVLYVVPFICKLLIIY